MEGSWTADQKNICKDNNEDLLPINCKKNGGPVASTSDVHNMVARITEPKILKSSLRTEVGFQKALHPFDAQERGHLYKMNQLSVEELIENLLILFDTSASQRWERIFIFQPRMTYVIS